VIIVMELGQAKKNFLVAKKSENVTGRTIEIYENILQRFFKYLMGQDVFDIAEVNAHYIRAFLVCLQEEGLKGVTRHQFYRGLKTFFLFLYREEHIAKNIIADVKPPKTEQKLMRTFTGQELTKMFKAFDQDTFTGMRNYCIFCLLFSTGIRKGEMLELKLADVNITNDLIKITNGKGQKQRFVPIGKTMRRSLVKYLHMREEVLKGESCEWLFITNTYRRKMQANTINAIFHRLKGELKFSGEKISAHTFRHTMAKNYLLNGGDLVSLQAILGHSDISTTRNYLNLNEKEVKNQHMLYNPLDNKGWLY